MTLEKSIFFLTRAHTLFFIPEAANDRSILDNKSLGLWRACMVEESARVRSARFFAQGKKRRGEEHLLELIASRLVGISKPRSRAFTVVNSV